MPLPEILPGYQPMKRRQLRLTLLTLLLALTGVGLVFLLLIYLYIDRRGRYQLRQSQTDRTSTEPSWVIVPGAPYYPGGRPGLMLEDRLSSAISLYRSGQVDRILISGDSSSDDYDEVSVMQRFLLENGADPAHIIRDKAGYDTYDTLIRVRDIFQIRRALITTQTYHLLRALYIGEKLGLHLDGIACDLHPYPNMLWHKLREVVARFKAWLDCEIRKSCRVRGRW